MTEKHNIDTLQLRQKDPDEISSHVRTDKVLMRLELESAPETLWNRFSAKVRNQVRKAKKLGLTVEAGHRELVPDFFRVYSQNMRDLGSPSHHRKFFEQVLDVFEAETRIYCVRLGNETVGAGLAMANGECLEIPWASSLRRYNQHCVNHLMYWHILEEACRDGFRSFHFGRSSRDSGTYKFKKQWGAEPVPLYWYYFTKNNAQPSLEQPPQETFGWEIRLWQRLPVWLTRQLGPRIISKVS